MLRWVDAVCAMATVVAVGQTAWAEPEWVYHPTGRQIHVAPNGTPDGDGSAQRPLDVFTALGKESPASPGDTIILAGGTYEGKMDGIKRVPFEWAVSGAMIPLAGSGDPAYSSLVERNMLRPNKLPFL